MAIKSLSILIPTYNDRCRQLVEALRQQAEEAPLSSYEIVVADDGSTDSEIRKANSPIATYSHCRYIEQPANRGRAAIRNFLAQTALYDYLLFIDSDMTVVSKDYLQRYLTADGDADVVDGGVSVCGDADNLRGNLRYLYELSSAAEHTVEARRKAPYRDFHTANFLIRRSLMLSHPFDERFRHYGYEDVIFGKALKAHKIAITHIDNTLGFSSFESNASFVAKTEEGLHTLHRFRRELKGYSRLLTFVDGIHIPLILSLIRLFHKLFGRLIRCNLCSQRPILRLFTLYKLGYYLTLPEE